MATQPTVHRTDGAPDRPPRKAATRAGRAPADRLLLEAAHHSAGRTAAICLLSTVGAAASVALPSVLGHALDLALAGDGGGLGPWLALCAALVAAEVLLDALAALLTGT
ncbi:MAG TPA: hypothetical protein VFY14_05515, partial [Streptomyces sp.]|nr:hypothetical protein [Streptomyces sp.]